MKPARALLVIGGVTLIAGLNIIAVAQSGLGPQETEPAAAPRLNAEGVTLLTWELLQRTKATPQVRGGKQGLSMDYPAELESLAGSEVALTGAGFLLGAGKDGKVKISKGQGGPIARFALMPADLQSCCGPACTPSFNGVVLVDCSENPIPRALWASGGRIATVEGTLRLAHGDDLGCAFGMTRARVRLLDPTGKVVVFEGLASAAD